MKKIFFLIGFTFLTNLVFTQGRGEVIFDTTRIYFNTVDSNWYKLDSTVYEKGKRVTETVLGDTLKTLQILSNSAVNLQNQLAGYRVGIINENGLKSTFNTLRDMVDQVSGGTNEFWNITEVNFGRRFIGRYRIVFNGGAPFFAELKQLNNGNLRLDEEGGAERQWTIRALNRNSFKVLNFEGNTYDVSEFIPGEKEGYFDIDRNIKLIKIQ